MLPECCNLRPDERGQLCLERSLTLQRGPSAGREAACAPSRRKWVYKGRRNLPSQFLRSSLSVSQQTAKPQ